MSGPPRIKPPGRGQGRNIPTNSLIGRVAGGRGDMQVLGRNDWQQLGIATTNLLNQHVKEINAAIAALPGGTVTSVSSANGDLTVATGTTTPVLTINSAPKLDTARTIAMTGDVAWSVSFDGHANVTAGGTLATVNSNVGTFGDATHVAQITVNAKGLITAVSNVAISAAGATWLPLVSGAEPPVFITDGAGNLITVSYTP